MIIKIRDISSFAMIDHSGLIEQCPDSLPAIQNKGYDPGLKN